jgi:hypothetical protein
MYFFSLQTIPVVESSKPVWPMIESVVVPKTMKSVELKVVVDFSRVSNFAYNYYNLSIGHLI